MAKGEAVNPLKRLRNHYRLVIMNEDTYEEVVKFKLNRVSAYIAFSTIFILMIALTTSLDCINHIINHIYSVKILFARSRLW